MTEDQFDGLPSPDILQHTILPPRLLLNEHTVANQHSINTLRQMVREGLRDTTGPICILNEAFGFSVQERARWDELASEGHGAAHILRTMTYEYLPDMPPADIDKALEDDWGYRLLNSLHGISTDNRVTFVPETTPHELLVTIAEAWDKLEPTLEEIDLSLKAEDADASVQHSLHYVQLHNDIMKIRDDNIRRQIDQIYDEGAALVIVVMGTNHADLLLPSTDYTHTIDSYRTSQPYGYNTPFMTASRLLRLGKDVSPALALRAAAYSVLKLRLEGKGSAGDVYKPVAIMQNFNALLANLEDNTILEPKMLSQLMNEFIDDTTKLHGHTDLV